MNILFGVALALSSAIFLVVLYHLAGASKIMSRKMFYRGLVFLMAAIVYSSVQTYGPRLGLDTPTAAYTPEVRAVEEAEATDLFETTRERVGQFDDRLEEERP
jgi:hypothetical protein